LASTQRFIGRKDITKEERGMHKIAAWVIAVAMPLTALYARAEGYKKNAVLGTKTTPHDQEGRKKGAVTKKVTTTYRKIDTKYYMIETPSGWDVGEETSFGQREIRPMKNTTVDRNASMSSMTGPGLGKQSWQQLYETSLYFITRYAPHTQQMRATPFIIQKSRQGFETCAWTMTTSEGILLQRHIILKHPNGNILALSVKIPQDAAKKSKDQLEEIFQHMVDTAVVR